MLITKAIAVAAICGALTPSCSVDPQRDGTPETQEIVDNLVLAGFPIADIQVIEDKVYTGRDALVTLQASREMLETDVQSEEQYRTLNMVSRDITKICVNPTPPFGSNAALMTGLRNAVAAYNALSLSFDFAVGPTTGCSANISITTEVGTGGLAGFPSNGLPYSGPVYIGDATAIVYGAGPLKHLIMHELGHCIGFRHSDYYDRSISCGEGGDEGFGDNGVLWIPGTPFGAVYDGSVYNSCYNSGSTGDFTSSDITALDELYQLRDDLVARITPEGGYWGTWRPHSYCKPGTWAVGYRMRVEPAQGTGDDTALNSVQLLCRDPVTSATEWISSYDGIWGSWHSSATCTGPGNYLKGASMAIELPQSNGDDTAANDAAFSCTNSSMIHAPGGQGWGIWGALRQCPAQSAVCGLSIRFEGWQGVNGDDTAMNGLALDCCSL